MVSPQSALPLKNSPFYRSAAIKILRRTISTIMWNQAVTISSQEAATTQLPCENFTGQFFLQFGDSKLAFYIVKYSVAK